MVRQGPQLGLRDRLNNLLQGVPASPDKVKLETRPPRQGERDVPRDPKGLLLRSRAHQAVLMRHVVSGHEEGKKLWPVVAVGIA